MSEIPKVGIPHHYCSKSAFSRISDHLPIVGYHGQHPIYNRYNASVTCPHMAVDAERTVSKFHSCAGHNPAYHHKGKSQSFLAAEPFEFVAKKVSPLEKNATVPVHCGFHIPLLELARVILSTRKTFTHISNLFLDHWLVPYGICRMWVFILFPVSETVAPLSGSGQNSDYYKEHGTHTSSWTPHMQSKLTMWTLIAS